MIRTRAMANAPRLDEALEEARLSYAGRRPKSQLAFEAAIKVMPGGNTRTVLFNGPFPLRIERGENARLWDVDGIEYVNLLGEFTAGIYGHTNHIIRKAIDGALDNGINLSAHTNAEITLASEIQRRFPSMELLRFTNSGTEANLMAVTAARIVTARDAVMVFSGAYHGSVFYFGGGGSPTNAPYPYIVGRFNEVDSTRRTLREHGQRIACVLVEPMIGSGGCIPASPDFLAMLREETNQLGAVLIFDEVMTSRLSMGGAQQLFGVTPDMTTLGKYLGGGMSFGAFGGRERFMEIFDPRIAGSMPHAGTFNNNVLTMAAGSAALTEILTEDTLSKLNQRGDVLRDRLNKLFNSLGLAMQATGMGSLMNIHPLAESICNPDQLASVNDRIRELLFLDLLESGFYIARRGFIALSLAVSDEDLDDFFNALECILKNRMPQLDLVSGN